MTISHADAVYGTRAALVRCESVTTVPARQPTTSYFLSSLLCIPPSLSFYYFLFTGLSFSFFLPILSKA